MPIRPKTLRRLAILAAVAAVMGGVAELVIHHRHARREAWLLSLRDKGLRDYQAGDYAIAADELDRYITLHDADDDVMLAYAVSKTRSSIGRSVDLHVAQDRLQEILSRKPGDLAAEHALLELCPATGDLATMERISDEILQHDPTDAAALEARVNTRLRQARFDDALTAAKQCADARPDDLEARLAVMQLMMRQHKPAQNVASSAAAFKAAPHSPAMLLLQSIATDYAGRRPAALATLREAAGLPIPEVAVAGQIVNLFDAFQCFDEASRYLESAAQQKNSPELRRALALRLWQQGKYPQILKLLSPLANDDPAVVALNAAALFETQQPDIAAALAVRLSKQDDRLSTAWALAVAARYGKNDSPAVTAAQLSKALSRDPNNGIFRAWLGDCYEDSGEITLATRHWRVAATEMPGWTEPAIKLSQGLLRHHRGIAAVQAAETAYDRRPGPQTAINLAIVRFAALDDMPADSVERDDLLGFINTLGDVPQLLPARVSLLSRTGRRQEAQAAVDDALKSPQKLDPDVAERLLYVLNEDGLSGAETLLNSVSPQHCSPDLLLQRTTWLAQNGRADQALSEWSEAILVHPGSTAAASLPWRIAQCRYLDAVASMRAAAAWRKLASDFPQSPIAQNAICSSTSLQADPQFIADTIDRLHAIAGDGTIGWRMQRARLLVEDIDTPASSANVPDGVEAVTLLTDVIREAPAWLAPRVQLASALNKLGVPATAIDHLRSALAIDPSSVPAELELITLMRQQGRADDIARALRNFAPPAHIDDNQRIALAAAMADAGLNDRAVVILTTSHHSLPPQGQLLLAEQYRQCGQPDQAAAVYADLLAGASPSPAALASAAEFCAVRGQSDQARQILQRLAASGAAPQDIAIATGRFEERFGSEAAALQQFQRAAATQSEIGAAALIDFHLRHGRGAEAVVAARQATASLPASRMLADRLIEAQATAARVQGPDDLKPLIDALSHDPSRAAEVAALKSLSSISSDKVPAVALLRTLRKITAEFPADLPLAQQTARLCIRQQDGDGAVAVAQQTVAALPNDPNALRLAVDAFRVGRRWDEMRLAAEQWQSRRGSPTTDTAAAIAEAMLGQGNVDQALSTLQPFRATIAADARSQATAATVLARVLLASGKTDQAMSVIGQLFPDAAGRRLARTIAQDSAPTLDAALTLFAAIRTATPAGAVEEQSDLADLLTAIGRKFNDRPTLSNAANAYRDYLKSVPTDNDARLSMAGVEQQLGQHAEAETNLRSLLTALPNSPAVKNDLACTLLAQEKGYEEAEHLARSAVEAQPNVANYQDTLARVFAVTGRAADARAAFQTALRLDTKLVPARVSLAKLMRDQGDTTAARTELRRVDGTLQTDPHAGDYVADELSALRAELTKLDQ